MARGYYRQLTKLLEANGFDLAVQAKGSHQKWRNDDGLEVIVPNPCKSRHTANGILKSAGIVEKL